MKTKTLVIIGIVAVLMIVAGYLLIQEPASSQFQEAPATNTLPEKQAGSEPGSLKTVSVTAPATETLIGTEAENKVVLKIDLPQYVFGGTPKDYRPPNLEAENVAKNRSPIQVPKGTTLLSKGCKVTSSDPEPIIGELAFVTDGEKEHESGTYVELGPNTQWVQIDLGKEKELHAACIWHFFGEGRVYRDVICQVSNDPDFIDTVQTVFNNDHDNSSKLGAGKEKEYVEDNKGRPFAINGVKGRYLRCYSRGNTSNEMNHYTEIEVFGKDL